MAGSRFTVIGVMEEKGDRMATGGWDRKLIVPFTTMWTRFIGNQKRGFELWMKAESFEKVDQALAEVMITLRRRHGTEEHFQFYTAKAVLEQVGQVSQVLKILLGGVASISLLVGGIGIMNIMLVSVTERTREIGLRKAVGARHRDILQQFLIESVVLSVSGGLIGILISGFITFGGCMGCHDVPHQRDRMACSGIAMGGGGSFRFFRVYWCSLWYSSRV